MSRIYCDHRISEVTCKAPETTSATSEWSMPARAAEQWRFSMPYAILIRSSMVHHVPCLQIYARFKGASCPLPANLWPLQTRTPGAAGTAMPGAWCKGFKFADTTDLKSERQVDRCCLREDCGVTCRLWKLVPSLTSRKIHLPPPASLPVFTQPPMVRV